MPVRWLDYITPTAIGLVSLAWVKKEVARQPGLSDAARLRLVDDLQGYEAPRRHGLRNNFIGWSALLGSAMLFDAFGAPAWAGFALALSLLLILARALAVRTLRWRIAQCVAEQGE